MLLIDKKSFLQLLKEPNSKQYDVFTYLFRASNENQMILKTQSEIAKQNGKSLEISKYSINKIFREFIKLNILGKVQKGKYILLI